MKRLRSALYAAAFLAMACHAQAQNTAAKGITASEFRQVLVDMGTYFDAHKNTDLRRQFESMSDESIQLLYSATPDPVRLQTLAAHLKEHDAAAGYRSQQASAVSPVAKPFGTFPACAPNTIIDTAAGSSCTPAYPDPNNENWQQIVNPIINVGGFSPSDYASVSSQGCSLDQESTLQQVTVIFQGLENTITPACSIIPAPINATCYVPLTGVAIADSASVSLYSDCIEQDGLVNAAEIDAAFHNTVTIFKSLNTVGGQILGIVADLSNTAKDTATSVNNLQTSVNTVQTSLNMLQTSLTALQNTEASNQALNFRIAIEEELLQAGTGGLGLFELPQSAGGYLENVRQVVADTIQKFVAAGQSIGNATTFLAIGDTAFSNKDYKTALTNYRDAYRLTVQ